jgi:hypothetical protein
VNGPTTKQSRSATVVLDELRREREAMVGELSELGDAAVELARTGLQRAERVGVTARRIALPVGAVFILVLLLGALRGRR